MTSDLLRAVLHTPVPVGLGALVSLLPLALHRAARRPLPEALGLCLLALPVSAAGLLVSLTLRALPPYLELQKLDPRTVVLFRSADTVLSFAALSAVVIALTALLAAPYRRACLAMVPGWVGVAAWLGAQRWTIPAFALAPPEDKVSIWTGGEPIRLAALLGAIGLTLVTATLAERPVARALALSMVLPLLCWPGFLFWWMLGEVSPLSGP